MNSRDPRLRYRQIRDASIRGAGAGAVALVSQTVLRIGSIVVLARLLSPEEFGVAAMAGVLLNLFTLVGDWGLTTASTQRVSLDDDQLSNLFWINSAVAVLLAAATAALSPLLALAFREPRVAGAALLLSIVLIAIGLGAQHEARMRRRLEYGSLQIIRVVAHGIGIAVGVISAIMGAGFWALIAMHVSTQCVRTVLYWSVSGWKPRRPQKSVEVGPIVRFACGLVPSRLLLYLSRNSGPVVLGMAAGAADLGLYNRSHTAVMTPLSYLLEPLEQVVPSSLSRLQEDPTAFRRLFSQTMMIAAFGGCGILGLVAAEAPAYVSLLLGDQWLSAIPLVRWLTLAGFASVIGKATGWVLVPLGAARKLVNVRIIRAVVSVAGVIVGWQWGAVGVAAGYSSATVLSLLGEVVYAARGTPLRIRTLIEAVWRPMLCTLFAVSVLLLIPAQLTLVPILLQLVLYCALYLGTHALLPGGWDVMRTARETISAALRRHTVE